MQCIFTSQTETIYLFPFYEDAEGFVWEGFENDWNSPLRRDCLCFGGTLFESAWTRKAIQKISGLPVFLNLPRVRDNLLSCSQISIFKSDPQALLQPIPDLMVTPTLSSTEACFRSRRFPIEELNRYAVETKTGAKHGFF
jgi:hypothetical protein